MRRTPLALLVLLLASPAPAQAADPPKLAATLAACESGVEPAQRFAVFTGAMPALAGTERMAMRFDLRVRRGRGARFVAVRAPKWGRWERSQPRRSGLIYTKRVEHLGAFAAYRAVVRFRWLDERGRVQRRATRRTAVCRQPDQRPDLRLVDIRPGDVESGGLRGYRLTIVNAGRTAAVPSLAALGVGGDGPVTREVARLGPGERVTLTIAARSCHPGERLEGHLDVRGDVSEAGGLRGNQLVTACPAV